MAVVEPTATQVLVVKQLIELTDVDELGGT
jgi:hypothetical protein